MNFIVFDTGYVYSMVVDIDELRRLLVLAEYERITDAAEALQMSQPTLSRLLARAEHELGVRLFERDAAGARPNPYGEVVLAAARDITRRYDQLREDLATLLDPETGTVRLAFMDSMATSLVPRILRDFRREAPHVRVALQQKPGHQMIPDLASGLTELAIIAPRPTGPHGWLPLQRQRLVLVVPVGHRLAARRQARLDELADEDFVTVPRRLRVPLADRRPAGGRRRVGPGGVREPRHGRHRRAGRGRAGGGDPARAVRRRLRHRRRRPRRRARRADRRPHLADRPRAAPHRRQAP